MFKRLYCIHNNDTTKMQYITNSLIRLSRYRWCLITGWQFKRELKLLEMLCVMLIKFSVNDAHKNKIPFSSDKFENLTGSCDEHKSMRILKHLIKFIDLSHYL